MVAASTRENRPCPPLLILYNASETVVLFCKPTVVHTRAVLSELSVIAEEWEGDARELGRGHRAQKWEEARRRRVERHALKDAGAGHIGQSAAVSHRGRGQRQRRRGQRRQRSRHGSPFKVRPNSVLSPNMAISRPACGASVYSYRRHEASKPHVPAHELPCQSDKQANSKHSRPQCTDILRRCVPGAHRDIYPRDRRGYRSKYLRVPYHSHGNMWTELEERRTVNQAIE